LPLVLWRMTIVVGALALVPRVWRALFALPARLAAAYAGIGVLVALHWLTFYGAVKLANASVAANSMALATPFVAIVEPRLAGALPPRPGVGSAALSVRLAGQAESRAVSAPASGPAATVLCLLSTGLGRVLPDRASDTFVLPDLRGAALLVTLARACTLVPFA